MRRLWRFGMAVLGLYAVLLAPAGGAAAPRLKVAATIFPLYDLVRQVAGADVDVVLLVPPGASPHTFAARPGTIRALSGSAAIFAIGHGLDDWATRLAQGVGISRVVVVDAGIALRPWPEAESEHAGHADAHAHGAVDPHYWLAVPNAVRMVQSIAETLGELDPGGRQAYRARAAAYQTRLLALDRDIRQTLQDLPQRAMAVLHPAFSYFAEAYGLRIVAIFTPAPGREPAPRQVERFLQHVRAHRLRVLFVEPQLSQGALRTMARDIGLTLQELDPLGGVPGRDSYLDLMRFNARQVAEALGSR